MHTSTIRLFVLRTGMVGIRDAIPLRSREGVGVGEAGVAADMRVCGAGGVGCWMVEIAPRMEA
jgi:hypothetical protein